MKFPIVFFFVLVCSSCNQTRKGDIDVVYNGNAFSFRLEKLGNTAFTTNMRGQSSGEGFRQATGELEDVFSQIFENHHFEMDEKWQGIYFKLTLNFSGDMQEDYFLGEITEEIQRETHVVVTSKVEIASIKCLEVVDSVALGTHIYKTVEGVSESIELADGTLKVAGKTLGGLVSILNELGHLNDYNYAGKDSNTYQFDLDVSDETNLINALHTHGLTLSDCSLEKSMIVIN